MSYNVGHSAKKGGMGAGLGIIGLLAALGIGGAYLFMKSKKSSSPAIPMKSSGFAGTSSGCGCSGR